MIMIECCWEWKKEMREIKFYPFRRNDEEVDEVSSHSIDNWQSLVTSDECIDHQLLQ